MVLYVLYIEITEHLHSSVSVISRGYKKDAKKVCKTNATRAQKGVTFRTLK